MKSFRCGDVIPGCDAEMTGSEESLMEQIAAHAASAHGLDSLPESLIPVIVSKMTPLAESS